MNKNFFKKTNQTSKEINKLTEIEKSYIAGFIDGDGSIYVKIVRDKTRTYKFALRVEVSVTQKPNRRWFLLSLQKKLGCGNLNLALPQSSKTKTVDNFTLSSMPLVRALLLSLQPYLILKRPQSRLALRIIDTYFKKKLSSKLEFIKLCKIADKLTALNDSKKHFKQNSITGITVEKELLADNSIK